MSFLGVRGLPRPPPGSLLSEEEEVTWSIQVQHGAQRQWTSSICMDMSEVRSSCFAYVTCRILAPDFPHFPSQPLHAEPEPSRDESPRLSLHG